MLINGVEPEKPTADRGPIVVVAGPRKDDERDILVIRKDVPRMSVNHAHKNMQGHKLWEYHVCNESLDPTKFDIPCEAYSIGLYCGKQSHPRIDQVIKLDHCQGGAGLLGVIAALYIGYSPVLTIGIYVDKPPYDGARREWEHWRPYLNNHVRALTSRGLVAEMFGVYDG